MAYYITQQSLNPFTRVLAALVGALALAGAFFFGIILFAVILGLGLLFWLGLRLRMWWLMRNFPDAGKPEQAASSGDGAIEGEFTVVSKERENTR